ncbi:MAG: efflux RND transporter periplasmic adaptor subunit [Woeseiaceae bacterium]
MPRLIILINIQRTITRCFHALMLALLSMPVIADDAPIAITVTDIAEILVAVQYDAAASVVGVNNSVLSAEVSAPVTKIHADVGESVKKGQALISLSGTDFDFQLQLAEANLERIAAEMALAESRLKRSQALAGQQYVSEDDVADQTSRLASLKAQGAAEQVALNIAKEALRDTTIRAPFDGVITARTAQLGALLQVGSPAIQVVQSASPEVAIGTNDQPLVELIEADVINFHYRSQAWPVKVIRVSDAIDQQTRLQEVRLRFTGDRPPVGQAGRLRWQSQPRFLPVPFVQQRDQQLGIFVVVDGKASFMVLDDAEEGRPPRFTGAADTQIVVEGRQRLNDGDAVLIKPR